jgi:hypothetical protein
MLNQQLILRSNRYLAASLLERKLTKSDAVEQANAKLLANLQSGNARYASVLSLLIYDLKALQEVQLIEHLVDKERISLVDLNRVKPRPKLLEDLDMDECWATLTLPFDWIGKSVCLATCYYLSRPVIDFWEQKYDHVLWYTAAIGPMTAAIESKSASGSTEGNEG